MQLVEIDMAEYDDLSNLSDTYFVNGVVFDDMTDNVVAIMEYTESGMKYYKMVRNE